jgi:hypothetical protein
MDLNKHIWEGWTVQDFIDDLEPQFNRIMENSHAFQTSPMTKEEIKKWCMTEQPYYKKYIPEVVNYFIQKQKQTHEHRN